MSVEYIPYGTANFIETNGSVSTEESIRHGIVLEESTCDGQVELTLVVASIYKEEDWKYGFAVCANITGCDEGKFGIGSDGILDPLKSEFPCNSEVVVAISKAIAKIGELYEQNSSVLEPAFETQKNNYHLLEERLVETVIITKECIT